MKPIENPWVHDRPNRNIKMQEEINLFLGSGAIFAELWKDDNVVTQRNVQLYQREARYMRIDNVEFHQHKGIVVAVRKDITKGKQWRTVK